MRMIHELHRMQQKAAALFEKAPLTISQALVLAAAAKLPGVTQTALVDATDIDRSTLADIVRRLCASGHLRRKRRKDDNRAYEVQITDKGKAALDEAMTTIRKVENLLKNQIRDLAAVA